MVPCRRSAYAPAAHLCMQDLHLVGFTTDRRHLIFSARRGAKSGGFVVPVDEHLVAAVEELANDPARLEEPEEESVEETPAPPRVEAKLSVREVQARLRSGESSADVAADAGVEQDWVERFAPPIRAEQRQIVERGLALPMERPRAGASAKPLGVAVAAAMAERGVALTGEAFDRAWSSRLVGRDHWVLEFRFTQRGRNRTVSWTFDVDEGRITTSDRTASQIGFVAPPESTATKTSAANKSATTKQSGAKKTTSASKSGAKKSSAKTTGAKKSSGKKSGARKRSTARKSAAGKRSSASSVTDDGTATERSTRGDGRPDSAKSTAAVKQAVRSTRAALESGVVRRPPPETRRPEPTPEPSEAEPDIADTAHAPVDETATEAAPPAAADVDPTDAPEHGDDVPVARDEPVVDDDGDEPETGRDDDESVERLPVDTADAVDEPDETDEPGDLTEAEVTGTDADDLDEEPDADLAETDWAPEPEPEPEPASDEHDDDPEPESSADDAAAEDADAEATEPSADERVRLRRALGRRRRPAEAPDDAGDPDDADGDESGDAEPSAPERRPTAQFRSGAAVPARSAPTSSPSADDPSTEARPAEPSPDATAPRLRPDAAPERRPEPGGPIDPERRRPTRRATAPTPDERPSRSDGAGEASTPSNGRRPRRTRPLRAR